MKIKPLHIYLLITLFAVVFIIITVSNKEEKTTHIHTQDLPNDEIHKGFGQSPSSGNVSETIKQQLENFAKQVKENPKDTSTIRQYAELLYASHKLKEALEQFELILKINPKRYDIIFSKSFIYFDLKDYQKAEELSEFVIKNDPSNIDAIYNLGAISAVLNKTEKAKQVWGDLIKKHPKSDAAILAKSSLEQL